MIQTSPFPDDFLSYSGNKFYQFVKNFLGEIEADILEVQSIKNVRVMLRITDVFSFFDINCEETLELKTKACFVTDEMNYLVRPGIRSNMEYFIELLRAHYSPSLINETPLSSQTAILKSDQYFHRHMSSSTTDSMDNNERCSSKSFLNIFIDNLVKNMNRSPNHYKYDPLVEKFASALHILAGNNAYEFIRINLPGSLPAVNTLKLINRNINLNLNECEFRFNSLQNYLRSVDSNFIFAASFSHLIAIELLKDFFLHLVRGCYRSH